MCTAIACAVLYFALFYYGSQKRHTFDNFVQDLQQADLDEKSYCEMTTEESDEPIADNKGMMGRQISPEVYQRLVIQFTMLIDEEKNYLKNDLRLDEVARLVHTTFQWNLCA